MNSVSPLNGPVEVAMRALVLLARAYPDPVDVSTLTVLDHAMLHSADFGGPPSLHPHLPAGPGELGMRRRLLHEGLAVLLRSGLAALEADDTGLLYRATGSGSGFVGILEAPYIGRLRDRADWVLAEYAPRIDTVRATQAITTAWREEFTAAVRAIGGGNGA